MNSLAVFYEHIFEAAEQSGISVEQALLHAKSCGIDYVESDIWRLSEREQVKQLFDRCGMGVSSIYAHFDMLHDSADVVREKYTDLFETAQYFGAEKVLCIPGFFDETDRTEQMNKFSDGLTEMCAAAEKYGIAVTVEDFDDVNSPCCRAADLLYLLQNSEGLKYTFDTGNFRYCLESAAEAYKLLKPYIAHVHCKDRSYDAANSAPDGSNGKADLSGAVMYPEVCCNGIVGMSDLLKELKADGYDGIFAIEHFGAADQLRYMKKSADNIRRALEEI